MSPPSRTVMITGFAALFLLVIAMVAAGFTHAHAVQKEIETLHQNYTSRSEQLRDLAVYFFYSGIELRDALLQPVAQGRTERFQAARAEVEKRLAKLDAAGDLKPPLDRYWVAAETVLANPASENLADLNVRRQSVLRVVLQLDRLNKDTQAAARQEIASMRAENKQYFLTLLAIALLVGLATAVFAWHRVGVLEHQEIVHKSELVRLSRSVVRAQEEERKNIARELHDELGQQLTGMGMLLGSLGRYREEPQRFTGLVDEARHLNTQTLRSVRTLALGLRPSLLDDLGLGPALEWFVREFSRRSTIPVNLSLEGDIASIPEPKRTALYRVVQESLTNVARHSRASRVEVRLAVEDGAVQLRVDDNGVGFDPKHATAQGQGLLGLSERVAEFDGRIQIDSKPGKGARLNVFVPLSESEQVSP